MARDNTLTLVGAVTSNPTVSYIEDFKTYKLGFSMRVLRRNNRQDEPHVLVYGLEEEEAKRLFQTVKAGTFIMVRGMVATCMREKIIKCEKCGAEKKVNTLFTEIIAYSAPVVLNGNYDPTVFREVANNLHIIGTVCTDVMNRCSSNGTSMTQYQIAVNRKYHVAEQAEKTDYPWVKTFGSQADEDAEHLAAGSQVYINGAIQTREVTRTITCDGCERQLSYKELVGEIVPYDVEYLNNCLFDESKSEGTDTTPPEQVAEN